MGNFCGILHDVIHSGLRLLDLNFCCHSASGTCRNSGLFCYSFLFINSLVFIPRKRILAGFRMPAWAIYWGVLRCTYCFHGLVFFIQYNTVFGTTQWEISMSCDCSKALWNDVYKTTSIFRKEVYGYHMCHLWSIAKAAKLKEVPCSWFRSNSSTHTLFRASRSESISSIIPNASSHLMFSGPDCYLPLLNHRNKPRDDILGSPTQRLKSKRIKTKSQIQRPVNHSRHKLFRNV